MPQYIAESTSAASRDTGSQRALREFNTRAVVTSLATAGPQTQSALARKTGLSTGTISNIVRQLLTQGQVTTRHVISSGRRAVEVELQPDGRVVVGIDVGRTHLRIALSTLTHQFLGQKQVKLELEHRPKETFASAAKLVSQLLDECAVERSSVVKCVVGLPASIDAEEKAVVQGSVLPAWADYPLEVLAEGALGLPVTLENDANLGALAQVTYEESDARNLIYIKLATGIGAGMVHQRHIYHSTSGLSGEIGHIQVVDGGSVCHCGNRGCLETVASTRSLVNSLNQIRHGQTQSLEDFILAAEQRDPAVLRLLGEAGTALGRVLATLGNLLAPDVIVIGGPLGAVGQEVLDSAMLSVRQRALPSVVKSTEFKISQMLHEAEVRGACALAIQLAHEGAGPVAPLN